MEWAPHFFLLSVALPAVVALPTFEERLERFEAPNPADTDWCRRAMRSGQTGPIKSKLGSQFGQDMTIFMNLFRDKEPVDPGTGFYKGFYVDSGANDFKALSNTIFFDKCLGWEGMPGLTPGGTGYPPPPKKSRGGGGVFEGYPSPLPT